MNLPRTPAERKLDLFDIAIVGGLLISLSVACWLVWSMIQ